MRETTRRRVVQVIVTVLYFVSLFWLYRVGYIRGYLAGVAIARHHEHQVRK